MAISIFSSSHCLYVHIPCYHANLSIRWSSSPELHQGLMCLILFNFESCHCSKSYHSAFITASIIHVCALLAENNKPFLSAEWCVCVCVCVTSIN